MEEFDKGPPKAYARLFAARPDYRAEKDHFWFDWGPIFYRGRLNGKARLLCVASDPGPTERIAGRALVGDAGQRVQGFLNKLGLTQSYVCLNAFIYALHPSHFQVGKALLKKPEYLTWRNQLFDKVKTSHLQAVVAFGSLAQIAVDLWEGKDNLPVIKAYHPSYRNHSRLLPSWQEAIARLRELVTPDPDGDATVPNYGDEFTDEDYAAIPRQDLPFGIPSWFGDDSWGRSADPRHHNCVSRPRPDDGHTLIWIAPRS